ncbi:unnamed protein product [Schistocephalus solidus]|uniref:MAM domain-containing protein n=1 Tax=Schistocephalus solidus TaxID=70667 RepID=A0A183TNR5_SCHSO|nr:unnamed protein product [Schistocephalus solidus]
MAVKRELSIIFHVDIKHTFHSDETIVPYRTWSVWYCYARAVNINTCTGPFCCGDRHDIQLWCERGGTKSCVADLEFFRGDLSIRAAITIRGIKSYPYPTWDTRAVTTTVTPVASPLGRGLELFPVKEEFLVSARHKLALITSLLFVHTAPRYYRLIGIVRPSDWRHCSASRKVGARQVPRRRPNLII